MPNDPINPYSATPVSSQPIPVAIGSGAEVGSPEEVRERFFRHEIAVKSISVVYFIGAAITLLSGIAYGVMAIATLITGKNIQQSNEPPMFMAGVYLISASIGIAFGVLLGWIAMGVRKLKPSARIGAMVFSAIGLFAFPLGTIINGYILYLVGSKKGEYVFSPHYKTVIAATPNKKYKMSTLMKVLIGMVIGFFGLMLIGFLVLFALISTQIK